MSLEKKSVHVRISQEMHEHLALMAEFHDKDIAELLAQWTEKVIVGEFHVFSLMRDRLNRLGLKGK